MQVRTNACGFLWSAKRMAFLVLFSQQIMTWLVASGDKKTSAGVCRREEGGEEVIQESGMTK